MRASTRNGPRPYLTPEQYALLMAWAAFGTNVREAARTLGMTTNGVRKYLQGRVKAYAGRSGERT